MSLTRVTPAIIAVTNNITSNTFGSANTIPSFQVDGSGVIIAASNTAITLTANSVANNQFQTGSIENYLNASGGSLSGRNRIINGDFKIDQRNNGASLTPSNGQYTLDRWIAYMAASAKFSVQKDSSANTVAGFTSSMKITSLSAYSVGSADEFNINQAIEGLNFADLRWGTADAAPITLSFWVRSSLTGTHGGCVRNYGISRSYPFSYTIVAANTWEKKTITISGDTSGTWVGATTAGSAWLTFGLGTGSTLSNTAGVWAAGNYTNATGAVSLVGTNGATWYVTGIQLEKGSIATPFEFRQYTNELALCQRYFWRQTGGFGIPALGAGFANQSTTARICIQNPVEMRAAMSYTYSGNLYLLASNASGLAVTSIGSIYAGLLSSMVEFGVSAGLVSGNGTLLCADNAATNYIQASAEL